MAYVIQKARLRRFFPGADGRANPWQWFVLDSAYETDSGDIVCVAGPFDTKREAENAADKDAMDWCSN